MPRRCAQAVLLLSLMLPWHGVEAQRPADGTLRVHVKDPSGRALRASGVLTGPGGSHAVETDPTGFLVMGNLRPGHYNLRLSRTGFAPQDFAFDLAPQSTLSRDLTLAVEGATTSITVIAAAPAGALDLPFSEVPAPVQTISAETIADTNALDLSDVLRKRLNGVYVNENQNNPFQPDVNYRGYTASPLLGTPQGLSVYVDGVRQNQPFGDVVAWDLVPKIAISTTELIPGSNPLYGLNTLGGALAVQTKSGLTHPGFSLTGYGGSFGRRAIEGEYGDSNAAGLHWYLAGTLFHEDGWRLFSPSTVRQSFAKLGYDFGRTSLTLSGAYSLNTLTGNGTQDIRAINRTAGVNRGYNSVYTIPDITTDQSPSLTLSGSHAISDRLTLSGNAYLRYVRTGTTNGDINNGSFDQSLYTLSAADRTALLAAGYTNLPSGPLTPANTPFPYLRCIAAGLTGNEPGEKCTGVVTDATDRQHAYGLSGVLSWRTGHSRLVAGAGWDRGSLTYRQASQYGYLAADGLRITRINSFLDGSTDVDGEPQDTRVDLHGTTGTGSVFATDTFAAGPWIFTLAGRYNRTTIDNHDRLPALSYRGTLTAVNVFERLNPAAGFVYSPLPLLHTYFNYSESSRAPTSTELGCADPNFPCSLPNALVSDPPLRQVVSRTIEAGVRGNTEGHVRWNAGYFHSRNDDDLLFVAAPQTGFGNFQNFGKTRRQGAEASLSAHLNTIETGANYTFLSATYQSPQTVNGSANSSNDVASAGLGGTGDGTITITPGDRIPLVPQHLLKLYTDWRPLPRLSVDADLNLIGSAFVRGNENNGHQPDGIFYLGAGKTPGYGIVNLGSRLRLAARYELFVQVNNLFNRRYYTAGQLASTPYDDNGNFVGRPFAPVRVDGENVYPVRNSTFVSPGAPVTVFGGLRVSFGRPGRSTSSAAASTTAPDGN